MAKGARNTTKTLFIKLTKEGLNGYGENAFPPYVLETIDEGVTLLKSIQLSNIPAIQLSHKGIQNAISMAYHDLMAKTNSTTIAQELKLANSTRKNEVFTVSESLLGKRLTVPEVKYLKIKVNKDNAAKMIQWAERLSKPYWIDFNQAFSNPKELIASLKHQDFSNCLFFEEPLLNPKNNHFIKLEFNQDIFADESISNEDDLLSKQSYFDGFNIKLAKCGGLKQAIQLQRVASEFQLKTILGCMSESKIGCERALQIAEDFDYIDLDGELINESTPKMNDLHWIQII